MKVGEREVEPVVVENITQAFPFNHEKILSELKWDSLNGCYYFHLGEMFVGVETDGYIHT